MLHRLAGKTQLAISLAIDAAQSGWCVYYGTLANLITSLEEAQAAGRLRARLKVLTHPAARSTLQALVEVPPQLVGRPRCEPHPKFLMSRVFVRGANR
jgi:hypothetical protein